MQNHAPAIAITHPSADESFVGSQQVVLRANANDLEDGTLGGSNVVWRSSLDGVLGTGAQLLREAGTLTEGTHQLSATATDSSGLTNVATLTIVVYREEPPLLEIALLGSNTLLSWPVGATNYHLQRATSLPGGWNNVTNATQIVDDKVQVTLPVNSAAKFYRLTKP